MRINKIVLHKEGVYGVGGNRAHSERRTVDVCTGTYMTYGSQILERMTFFLKRIIRCGLPFYLNFGRVYFKRLICLGRHHKYSPDVDCGTDIELGYFVEIGYFSVLKNYLKIFEGTSVVYFKKAESL